MTPISDYLNLLRSSDPLLGIPLTIAGLIIMLMGWRIWRFCMVATFTLIGLLIAQRLAGQASEAWLYMFGGAILLGGVGLALGKHGITILGGCVGAALAQSSLQNLGLYGPALWISALVAFLIVAPLCHLNRDHVSMLIAAFEGATLLLSGLLMLAMAEPWLYRNFKSMNADSSIFLPFMVLVPTVISYFLQVADLRQKERGN